MHDLEDSVFTAALNGAAMTRPHGRGHGNGTACCAVVGSVTLVTQLIGPFGWKLLVKSQRTRKVDFVGAAAVARLRCRPGLLPWKFKLLAASSGGPPELALDG
jgi:hypothetical protein